MLTSSMHIITVTTHWLLVFFLLVISSLLRKSSNIVLLHWGHLGSTSGTITYIRHRVQPTRSMVFVSSAASPDTHDPSDEWIHSVDKDSDDSEEVAALGGDNFSPTATSNVGLLDLLLMMVNLNFLTYMFKITLHVHI